MDFRSLQLFKHLSNSLHFGDTASAMFVSPSTLSRVIQRLEEECGSELFIRDNRSVALTEAGEILANFASDTLTRWEETRKKLQQDSEELHGELSLYCSVTASQSHLPNLIQQLGTRFPKVTLKLQTGDPAYSFKKIENRQVDVALGIKPPNLSKDLFFMPLDNVPLVLIAPKAWKINSVDSIDWNAHPLVLPEQGYARDMVKQWVEKRGVKPNIYASVGGNEAIVAMVALGCGFGLVPQIVLDHSMAAHHVHRIAVPDIAPYKLGLCCLIERKNHSLTEALFNVAAQLSFV